MGNVAVKRDKILRFVLTARRMRSEWIAGLSVRFGTLCRAERHFPPALMG